MGKFNRDDRGPRNFVKREGGGRDFGGSRGKMFEATCSKCGKACEVPFKPIGNRPIFCSTCFGKQESLNENRRGERSFDRPSFGNKRERDFSSDRPAPRPTENYREQFEMLNAKLDRILRSLETRESRPAALEINDEEEMEMAPAKVKKARKKKSK